MIYIDLGCHDGTTINEFKNWRWLRYTEEEEFKIYGFDPNPRWAWHWSRIGDAKFSNKAAWLNDKGKILSLSGPDDISSTIMKEKNGFKEGKQITAKTFDFSTWLKKFRGEEVIIKMDIEGAELPVLTKMIEDKTDDIAELTMVEFHDGKMPSYDSNKDWILKNYRGRLVLWR